MKRSPPTRNGSIAFERSYLTALGEHLKKARGSGGGDRIGRLARSLGVETLDLARIHERAAASLARPAASTARQRAFFTEAVEAHIGANGAVSGSRRRAARPGRGSREASAARARLAREVQRRKALQAELVQSERRQADLASRSRIMEKRLRGLSHRLLSALEEERRRISRDLHDAIGQTLTGINVGLATLKHDAAAESRDLAEALAMTQRLVERSMKTVHQFAWELRPTLLDDLGLVPALRSYAKTFSQRTGIKVLFTADAKLERMDDDRSISLFRVAQGALSNVERHARAGRVRLLLRSVPGGIRLEVKDDGRSFDVQRMETSKKQRHLGLLVMRERVEMVGGRFTIASSQGRGTTVRADVPLKAGGVGE
jgi:signal transduction histidine kinase